MLTHYRAVQEVARKIGKQVDVSTASLREGEVQQEPHFTDRMLGRIEGALDDFQSHGIKWKAKTLGSIGSGAIGKQESLYGADFLVTVSFDLIDYKITKGFLAQAKLLKNGLVDNLSDLKSQCEKMLRLSPVSYVFLYDKKKVRVVPAISVVASNLQPTEHYSQSASHFFEEHLKCFVGDRNIQHATPEMLKELMARFETRRALALKAKPVVVMNEVEARIEDKG